MSEEIKDEIIEEEVKEVETDSKDDIIFMLTDSMAKLKMEVDSINKAMSTMKAAVPVNEEVKEEEEKSFEDYFK